MMVVSLSVLEQGEDIEGLDLVHPPQLFQLHDHHTFQDLGLELLQQLTGSNQRPCNTNCSEEPGIRQNRDAPYYQPIKALNINTGVVKKIGKI